MCCAHALGGDRVFARVRDACAVRATGEVACWGSNEYGIHGDGTTTPKKTVSIVRWR
jgi:hypothetical protein